ncbi:MAG: restriction endonuclease [Proteobacteria bacterium]|nr:restriction endonuclease [Pseudomonadota bacterium]
MSIDYSEFSDEYLSEADNESLEMKAIKANEIIKRRSEQLRSILKNSNERVSVWECPDIVIPPRPMIIDIPESAYGQWGEAEPKEDSNMILSDPAVKLKNKLVIILLSMLFVFGGAIGALFFWLGVASLFEDVLEEGRTIIFFAFALFFTLPSIGFRRLRSAKIKQRFKVAHEEWLSRKREVVGGYKREWESKKKGIEEEYNAQMEIISTLTEGYRAARPEYISAYIHSVLEENHKNHQIQNSELEVEYIADNRIAIVDRLLLSLEDLPKYKEARFIKTTGKVKFIEFSIKEINEMYDDIIYQLCLSDVNQIFLTDVVNGVDAVVYNGWVNSLDKSTGHCVKACILSLQVSKEKFLQINLQNISPKECFRGLKGIGSARLSSIIPIAPIMQISREDRRFIKSYDVAHTLDEETNLAAMDWQDFEHLVRETFSKVFSGDGMEVKVTQSSKDKGVDAIAFDPDPVRGGKIVIQAKRYTNVVGVAAVRDLYGTMMNEGAMKGILVTTSHFGSDAYDFVKGKPLTLISGGELLTILAEQGYKAKIDLKEAKKILGKKSGNLRLVQSDG